MTAAEVETGDTLHIPRASVAALSELYKISHVSKHSNKRLTNAFLCMFHAACPTLIPPFKNGSGVVSNNTLFRLRLIDFVYFSANMPHFNLQMY